MVNTIGMNGINCQLLISRLGHIIIHLFHAKKQKKKGGVIGEKKIVKDNYSVRIRAAVWVYIFENILNNSKFKMQKSSY